MHPIFVISLRFFIILSNSRWSTCSRHALLVGFPLVSGGTKHPSGERSTKGGSDYLGMRITQATGRVTVDQEAYAIKVAARYEYGKANPTDISLVSSWTANDTPAPGGPAPSTSRRAATCSARELRAHTPKNCAPTARSRWSLPHMRAQPL
jgi:hypothetical protein